jgi:hypothetical protein
MVAGAVIYYHLHWFDARRSSRATDLHIEKRDTSPRSRSKEAEARELEYAVADHDAPSPISIDSGGDLPCLSQTVEGASSILVDGGYAVDFATPIGGDRPQATGLRDAATRLGGIVMRVRAAGESQPDPASDVLDIIGPAKLSGETFLITRIR